MAYSFLKCMISICAVALCLVHTASSQGCDCQNYFPPCPPPEAACSSPYNQGTWQSGTMDVPLDYDGIQCNVKVYFCGRNLTATSCEKAPYDVSCEYKLTKVCFPQECGIVDCFDVEWNGVFQNLLITIAKANPLNHFVGRSGNWPGYKTAWKLSFPECIRCTIDPVSGCTTVEKCNPRFESSCWSWYEAYKCDACPTSIPSCTIPCPDPTTIQLSYIPASSDEDGFTCPQQTPPCIHCGF